MKKVLAMLLASAMVLGLVACAAPATSEPAATEAAPAATEAATQAAPAATQAAVTEAAPASEGDADQTLHLYYKFPKDENSYDFIAPWGEADTGIIGNLMWLPLLRADKNMEVKEGAIFKDWNQSDDGLTFKFTLDTSLFWSDGTPITMDDIMFTFESLCTPGCSCLNVVRDGLKYLEGYDAFQEGTAEHVAGITVDGDTVTMKLTAPYAPFLKLMAQVCPLPKHVYGDIDVANSFQMNPIWQEVKVNSGPFSVTEHKTGNFYVLEPNPYYKGKEAKIKRIECTASPDGIVDAQAGNIDVLFSTDYEAYKAMSNNADYSCELLDIIYYSFLCFNFFDENGTKKDFVSDVRVREAIACAIDWETVIKGLYGDFAEMTQTGCLPTSENYIGDWYEYNPEKAKKLLDEAGFDYSHTIKVYYYLTEQTCIDLMDAMAYYLDQIGVKMEAVYTANAGADIYQGRTQDIAYFVLYGYDELTWYQMYTRPSMDKMIDSVRIFEDPLFRLETAYTPELWKAAITEVQNLDKDNILFLPINTLKYQAWTKNTLKTPENCFGNTAYYYDFQFEDWEIVK